MSYTDPIAENWRRFQAELFPEIDSDIGILLQTHPAVPDKLVLISFIHIVILIIQIYLSCYTFPQNWFIFGQNNIEW